MELVYKLIVILSGALLFVINLLNIAKKKMDVGIGSWWAVAAVILIVFGAVFNFSVLRHLILPRNLILLYLLSASVVITLYLYGLYISRMKKVMDAIGLWISYARSGQEPGKDAGPEQDRQEGVSGAAR